MTLIVTTSLALKTDFANAVVSRIGNAGKLQLRTSGGTTLLCEFTLSTPFGTVDGGTAKITGGGTPISATASATGDAAVARYLTSGGTQVIETNVGLTDRPITVDTGTDVITAPYHNYPNGELVTFTGASLPAPLVANTYYEVGDVANTGTGTASFKVYKDRAVVNITTAGSGTMTVSNNAGVKINTGSAALPSLTITSGDVIAIASYTIPFPSFSIPII